MKTERLPRARLVVDGDERIDKDVVENHAAGGFSISPVGVVGGSVHRLTSGDDPLGGSAVSPETLDILRRRHGGGQALPEHFAGTLSEQLGVDLSSVRVHSDAESHTLSRSLQATAFTHGSDIYFGQGAYNPGSTAGQKVLIHELAHVAQQAGEPATHSSPIVGRADDPAEAAADTVAHTLMQRLRRSDQFCTDAGPGAGVLQRMTDDGARIRALRRQAQRATLRHPGADGGVPRRSGPLLTQFLR